jgi:hypothetical protein
VCVYNEEAMAKAGKKKVIPVNLIKLYAEDELEYIDDHYVEANQRLQHLDDRKYLTTFYFKESEVLN